MGESVYRQVSCYPLKESGSGRHRRTCARLDRCPAIETWVPDDIWYHLSENEP